MSMENDNKFGILLARQFQERLEIIREYPEDHRLELLNLCIENEVNTSGVILQSHQDIGLSDDELDRIIEDISKYNAEIEQDVALNVSNGFFNSGKGEA